MNDKVKVLGCIVQIDDNFVDQGAGDLLFQHRRTGEVIPNRGKVFTQFSYCFFLSRAERLGYSIVRTELDFDFISSFELLVPALLKHLGNQSVRGLYLVVLIKRPLGLIF